MREGHISAEVLAFRRQGLGPHLTGCGTVTGEYPHLTREALSHAGGRSVSWITCASHAGRKGPSNEPEVNRDDINIKKNVRHFDICGPIGSFRRFVSYRMQDRCHRHGHGLSDVKERGVPWWQQTTLIPLEWNDNGTIKGYDIDIMAEVANRLGVRAEFISSKGWPSNRASGGQYDAVISCINITPKREKEANFVEYQQWLQVIVTSTDSEPLTSLEELEGKTIAVQVATTREEMALSVKDAQVTSFESFDTTFMELKNKRCDAIIIDEPVGMYYQKREPESFVITGTAGERAPVGIAVRKNALELTEAISSCPGHAARWHRSGNL